MNIMFWNTKRTTRFEVLKNLITEYDCDIAAFAEFNGESKRLISMLSDSGFDYYFVPIMVCDRIHIFTKIKPEKVDHFGESEYYTIKSFPHKLFGRILIAFVHFTSKTHSDENDQLEESKVFRSDLERDENLLKTSNTIVLGDFNMNPFEKGMLSARALNAFPTKNEVQRKERTVKGKSYRFFYNPMWSFFGDRHIPLGSYYYNASKHYTLKWNIFDQVLVRPEIMDKLNIQDIKIISDVGDINLCSNSGKPTISDHLPLFLKI